MRNGCLMGRVSVWDDVLIRVLEMNGGDSCTMLWIYLILLNCTYKNDLNSKIYVIYILKLKHFNSLIKRV